MRNHYKKRQRMQILNVVSGWLLSVALFAAGGFIVLGVSGKYNLEKQAVSYAAQRKDAAALAEPGDLEVLQQEELWQDGEIEPAWQAASAYRYKDAVLTFLLIGIGTKKEGAFPDMDAARTEALALVVLDSHEKSVKLIPIRCDTMTRVGVYDKEGRYAGTVTAQIGVRHGFDTDIKTSCSYQVKAVQELFYGIPISGYLAADMGIVREAAELIEKMDAQKPQESTAQEEQKGQAYRLAEFIGRGIRLLGKEPASALKIYHEISGRITTDITADEAAYLAAIAGDYNLDADGVVTISGKNAYEEENAESGCRGFIVDEDALYRLVLDLFYEPVE